MRPEPAPDQSHSQVLDDLLAQLAQIARELPGEDGSLWQDAAFQRRYQTLRVTQLGLTALAVRAEGDDCLSWALSHRRDVLRRDLAELAFTALGYQALPDPDPLLIDNEGPIGHHLALKIMRALADYFEPVSQQAEDIPAVSAGLRQSFKSRIASRVFGTE